MDQVEEKEENRFQESTSDRCKEDKEQNNNSEESSVDQRKEEDEEEKEEETEGPEEATATVAALPSFFLHPCSLLQYIARICACCLGLSDSFCDPKPSAALPEPVAAADPSQEGEEEDMKSSEATIQVRAARIRPRPPSNPREGSGGKGGHHN
uniref:Uncharacterized protein n=1 Tax=Leersia perrieri TaxID=77586 RepID=A0A0D9WA48_9ORYZ